MFQVQSTQLVPSKKFEGVVFRIRTISDRVRTDILIKLIDVLAEIRELQKRLSVVSSAVVKQDDGLVDMNATPFDAMEELQNVTDRLQLLRKSKVNPVYAEMGFASVEGLSIDGNETPSLKELRDFAPSEMYEELVDSIRFQVEMDESEKQNLGSPTTSGEQEVASAMTTIAPIAERTDFTSTETVESITRS